MEYKLVQEILSLLPFYCILPLLENSASDRTRDNKLVLQIIIINTFYFFKKEIIILSEVSQTDTIIQNHL